MLDVKLCVYTVLGGITRSTIFICKKTQIGFPKVREYSENFDNLSCSRHIKLSLKNFFIQYYAKLTSINAKRVKSKEMGCTV